MQVERVSSGTPGFDKLLSGGLPANRLYVISGPPGSGKTTLSSQFIVRGVRNGESVAYISMHESEDELRTDMGQFGFGFEKIASKIKFLDLMSENHASVFQNTGSGVGW